MSPVGPGSETDPHPWGDYWGLAGSREERRVQGMYMYTWCVGMCVCVCVCVCVCDASSTLSTILSSPRGFLQSTMWPHQSTEMALERAASHIKMTSLPCLFQLPPSLGPRPKQPQCGPLPVFHAGNEGLGI